MRTGGGLVGLLVHTNLAVAGAELVEFLLLLLAELSAETGLRRELDAILLPRPRRSG